MASSVFQGDVFQGGGVFQTFTPISIDDVGFGNILDKSPRISLTSLDVTLVDPLMDPDLGTDVVWGHHVDWTGTVTALEASTWRDGDSDHRYLRVTATNETVIADEGALGFGLSDAPDEATTYGFRDLVLQRRLKDGTISGTTYEYTEVRAKLKCFQDGVYPGYEIDLTSAADGLTAETFTIMAYSVSFPTWDAPVYDLDLGLGEYTAEDITAAPGPFEYFGDLGPDTFADYVSDVADSRIFDRTRVYTWATDPMSPAPTEDIEVGPGQLAVIWSETEITDVTQTGGGVSISISDAAVPLFAYVYGEGTFQVTNSGHMLHIVVGPGYVFGG